ncbi:hypothetical protein BDZ45DRAFT_748771 [Acephala macrosclerotiorum]|nr:hypothetical protein BDZ45DRAFT_748771 [Acephala macrosclerotiorum]
MATFTPHIKLVEAFIELLSCAALNNPSQPSPFRKLPFVAFILIFEQLVRNRRISFLQTGTHVHGGSNKIDGFLQLFRVCKQVRTVIGAWAATTDNIKWGGPVCGFFDPRETVIVIDIAPATLSVLRPKLIVVDEELRKSEIKSWTCLSWNPVEWWFRNAFFANRLAKMRVAQLYWKQTAFQDHARHIEIDLSGIKLQSYILLLDTVLSYLGPLQNIEILDIKVKTLSSEPWPPGSGIPDREAQMPNSPTVPVWAVMWKWLGLCDPVIPSQCFSAPGVRPAPARQCCPFSCFTNRPKVRYWNILDTHQKNWDELKFISVGHDDYYQHKLVRWTCNERRFWHWKKEQVQDASRWIDVQRYGYQFSNGTACAELPIVLREFLVDIGASQRHVPSLPSVARHTSSYT